MNIESMLIFFMNDDPTIHKRSIIQIILLYIISNRDNRLENRSYFAEFQNKILLIRP